jgi:PD-(D/E)XK nuclease superfamily protein
VGRVGRKPNPPVPGGIRLSVILASLRRNKFIETRKPFDMNRIEKSDVELIDGARSILIKFFDDSSLTEYIKIVNKNDDDIIISSQNTLEKMHTTRVTTFNPFISSGFSPNENNFTLTLASLFNPNIGHGFDKAPLTALLEAARLRADGTDLANNVESIINALNHSESKRIRVETEFYHRDGRPDMVIFGNDATKFIVLIENKKIGGSETVTKKGKQTRRHALILKELTRLRQVDEACAIAILLTPYGSNASDQSFIPLSSGELAHSIWRRIDMLETVDFRQRDLTRSFLTTYTWLNGGIL